MAITPDPTPDPTPDQPANAGNQFGAASERVINDMLSGNAMNAYRTQQNAALNRAEGNQRANTARQIQRAGFAGTPMGAMAGNAAESQILQNRFTNNLDLEVQRQNMQLQGVEAGMQYDRFKQEQSAAQSEAWELSGKAIADGFARNLWWGEAVNSGDPMRINDLMNDPEFNKIMQERWERSGRTGQFTRDWALQQAAAASDPRLTDPQEAFVYNNRNWINPATGTAFSADDLRALYSAAQTKAAGIKFNSETGQFEFDEDEIDWTETNPISSNAATEILADESNRGSQEYRNVITSIVNRLGRGGTDGITVAQLMTYQSSLPPEVWGDIASAINASSIGAGPGYKREPQSADNPIRRTGYDDAYAAGELVRLPIGSGESVVGRITETRDYRSGRASGRRMTRMYTITTLDGRTFVYDAGDGSVANVTNN